ncbi:MAG: hypothetical protein JJT81_17270 [Rubellimicrobium sp.]|nr:hypothetical protein [Rubellimicrobium sp.]
MQSGDFSLSSGVIVRGSFSEAAEDRQFRFTSMSPIELNPQDTSFIQGTLDDGRCVSLLGNMRLDWSHHPVNLNEKDMRRYSATIHSSRVLIGRTYFNPEVDRIQNVSFSSDQIRCTALEAIALRGPYQVTRGEISGSRLEAALREVEDIELDEELQIYCDNGAEGFELFSSQEVRIVLDFRREGNFSPNAINIRIVPFVDIAFAEARELSDCLDYVRQTIIFLDLASNFPHDVDRIELSSASGPEWGRHFTLESSFPLLPKTGQNHRAGNTRHPVNLNLEPEVFQDMFERWQDILPSRRLSLFRFDINLRGNSYNPDRHVTTSSCFDLLPVSTARHTEEIKKEIDSYKLECKQALSLITNAEIRQQLENALNHATGVTLRQKVEDRIDEHAAFLNSILPGIKFVCGEAIRYRNILVHGSNGKQIEYSAYPGLQIFLTESLDSSFKCNG